MSKFTVNDLKSLASTISGVVQPVEQKNTTAAFTNSLTEKARQVNEAEEKKESAATEKAEGPKHDAEEEMKKMMAKALKRAKKKARLVKEEEEKDEDLNEARFTKAQQAKMRRDWVSSYNKAAKRKGGETNSERLHRIARENMAAKKAATNTNTNEEVELAEKAAPGYEAWASDPKVKASFKKQYGNRWKQVMYAKSWKMSKMDEENEQLDEEWGGGFQSSQDAHREVQAGLRREASAHRKMVVSDIKAVLSGKMTKNAFTRKHKIKFGEHTLAKRMAAKAKARRLAESEQLEEGYDAKRLRLFRKNKPLSPENVDFLKRSHKKRMAADDRRFSSMVASGKLNPKWVEGRKNFEYEAMRAKGLAESEQLDEAGYKRLMRLRKAAYKAGHTGSPSHGRKSRAAAEREAQVAAGMARRGGASPDAVRGGGSRIGKSGKYTQKAGALANQRDKALAKFRGRAGYNKAQGMSRSSTEKQISRNTQQFQDDIRNRSRSGDFGQDNQAALRARSNFQKRYGRLKGK